MLVMTVMLVDSEIQHESCDGDDGAGGGDEDDESDTDS